MFATRNDQENLVHNHQQAAAAKPLNHAAKGYGAKTPAPKTPFRIPLNDENAARKAPNKDNEPAGLGVKKGGAEAERNAFLTPAGPRNRAPLGMKTTNAKARAFQTPGPNGVEAKKNNNPNNININNNDKTERALQRTVSPRLKRAKVKVHQPEPATQDAVEVDSEPEIEHAPPREVPLPDYPESDAESESYFGPDKRYPMFEGENMTRGIHEAYLDPVDEDGERASERRDRLALERYHAQHEREFAEQVERERREQQQDEARMRAELGLAPPKAVYKDSGAAAARRALPAAGQMLARASKSRPLATATGTPSAKSAAAALAAPKKSSLARQQASTAAATASAAAAAAPPAAKSKSLSVSRTRDALAAKTSNTKNLAGIAASRSTVGYGKGRAVSSTVRNVSGRPASAVSRMLPKGDQENARPALAKKVTEPVPSLASLGLDDGGLDDELGARPPLFDDDEDELFQLKLDG